MIKRFDVAESPFPATRDKAPYVIVLQSHLLHALDTVIVAPLFKPEIVQANEAVAITVEFKDASFTVDLALLTHLPRQAIKRTVGNLLAYDYEISRALDRLFTGF